MKKLIVASLVAIVAWFGYTAYVGASTVVTEPGSTIDGGGYPPYNPCVPTAPGPNQTTTTTPAECVPPSTTSTTSTTTPTCTDVTTTTAGVDTTLPPCDDTDLPPTGSTVLIILVVAAALVAAGVILYVTGGWPFNRKGDAEAVTDTTVIEK